MFYTWLNSVPESAVRTSFFNLSVRTRIYGTPWPTIMKLCVWYRLFQFSTLNMFENPPSQNCIIWNFRFGHFPPIFVISKLTSLVTLFCRKLHVFKNSPKRTIFDNVNELLLTRDQTVKCKCNSLRLKYRMGLFWDFQTLWNIYRRNWGITHITIIFDELKYEFPKILILKST